MSNGTCSHAEQFYDWDQALHCNKKSGMPISKGHVFRTTADGTTMYDGVSTTGPYRILAAEPRFPPPILPRPELEPDVVKHLEIFLRTHQLLPKLDRDYLQSIVDGIYNADWHCFCLIPRHWALTAFFFDLQTTSDSNH